MRFVLVFVFGVDVETAAELSAAGSVTLVAFVFVFELEFVASAANTSALPLPLFDRVSFAGVRGTEGRAGDEGETDRRGREPRADCLLDLSCSGCCGTEGEAMACASRASRLRFAALTLALTFTATGLLARFTLLSSIARSECVGMADSALVVVAFFFVFGTSGGIPAEGDETRTVPPPEVEGEATSRELVEAADEEVVVCAALLVLRFVFDEIEPRGEANVEEALFAREITVAVVSGLDSSDLHAHSNNKNCVE